MRKIISISMGNTKMGPIPSFSLLPKVTCNLASCCKKGCYACRMMRRRKSIRMSWERNTDIVLNDLKLFESQMMGWLAIYQPKAFRIHVGGDFFSAQYLKVWCSIAKANPRVRFFAFTKQWGVLLQAHKSIPKNLSIILSAWLPSTEMWIPPDDLRKRFPVAWMYKDSQSFCKIKQVNGERRLIQCEGHCDTCGKCFNIKRKDGNILFKYH